MPSCTGNGTCFEQCICCCVDDNDCDLDVCECGHRDHNTGAYCHSECEHGCQLVECHNYELCGEKRPQWVLDCHNGMCVNCAVSLGKIRFTHEKGDCPVCLDNKELVEICCGRHNVCMNCWTTIGETSDHHPVSCPLCRRDIWKR